MLDAASSSVILEEAKPPKNLRRKIKRGMKECCKNRFSGILEKLPKRLAGTEKNVHWAAGWLNG